MGASQPFKIDEPWIDDALRDIESGAATSLNLIKARKPLGSRGAERIALSLRRAQTLSSVYLSGHLILSHGVQSIINAVRHTDSLTVLDLSFNEVDAEGAEVFADDLAQNGSIKMLNLGCNFFGSHGASCMAAAMESNCTLVALNLSCNNIGAQGVERIATALRKNTTLQMLNIASNLIGPDGVRELSAALQENQSLATLNLADNGIGDDGVGILSAALTSNQALTNLDLSGNEIGPYKVDDDNSATGMSLLATALENNQRLMVLNLNFNALGNVGASFIGRALATNTCLSSLSLRRNSIAQNGARNLGSMLHTNRALKTLVLRSNAIRSAEVLGDGLGHNSTLTTLDLGNAQVQDECSVLNAGSLTSLDLSSNPIFASSTRTEAFANALRQNNALASLKLRNADVNNLVAEQIMAAVIDNSSLTFLDMGHNHIHYGVTSLGGDMTDHPSKNLEACLEVNRTLQHLDLSHAQIQLEALKRIATAVEKNNWLTGFVICPGGRSVGEHEKELAKIREVLKTNATPPVTLILEWVVQEDGCLSVCATNIAGEQVAVVEAGWTDQLGSLRTMLAEILDRAASSLVLILPSGSPLLASEDVSALSQVFEL